MNADNIRLQRQVRAYYRWNQLHQNHWEVEFSFCRWRNENFPLTTFFDVIKKSSMAEESVVISDSQANERMWMTDQIVISCLCVDLRACVLRVEKSDLRW